MRRTLRAALVTLFGAGGCVGFEAGEAGGAAGAPASLQVQEEGPQELFEAINDYRAANGLGALRWSPSLAVVAEAHVRDLERNYQAEPCSLHSWSDQGPWSSCCYLRDAPSVACMWDKPAELSGYPGKGYEIAVEVFGARPLDAQRALTEWRASPAHDDVILNRGTWRGATWRAVGVALSEHYAVVWFGKVDDPAAAVAHP